ncbi:hypothetical protein AAIH16_34195, partial [Pseudomonas aeruginosa]
MTISQSASEYISGFLYLPTAHPQPLNHHVIARSADSFGNRIAVVHTDQFAVYDLAVAALLLGFAPLTGLNLPTVGAQAFHAQEFENGHHTFLRSASSAQSRHLRIP